MGAADTFGCRIFFSQKPCLAEILFSDHGHSICCFITWIQVVASTNEHCPGADVDDHCFPKQSLIPKIESC
jgi:hypothetical protein